MYLLDTNILSELIKKRPAPHLIESLGSRPVESLYTSSICVMELRFGSSLRDDSLRFWKSICEEILSRVQILPVGEKEALLAGDILASLRTTGKPIGTEDVLIAASALAHDLIVVTGNVSHFSVIENLTVENWLVKD